MVGWGLENEDTSVAQAVAMHTIGSQEKHKWDKAELVAAQESLIRSLEAGGKLEIPLTLNKPVPYLLRQIAYALCCNKDGTPSAQWHVWRFLESKLVKLLLHLKSVFDDIPTLIPKFQVEYTGEEMNITETLKNWDTIIEHHRSRGGVRVQSVSGEYGEVENTYATSPMACTIALFDSKLSILRHSYICSKVEFEKNS